MERTEASRHQRRFASGEHAAGMIEEMGEIADIAQWNSGGRVMGMFTTGEHDPERTEESRHHPWFKSGEHDAERTEESRDQRYFTSGEHSVERTEASRHQRWFT